MPIYEYRCTSCGHELEALQKLSEAPLVNCPTCQRDALTKLVSAAGFQLKGSGWYATDFRNGSKPAAKAPAKSETAGSLEAGKSDTKAESKSETKSAASSDGASSSSAASGGCASN